MNFPISRQTPNILHHFNAAIAAFLCLVATSAHAADYRIGTTPNWVVPVPVPAYKPPIAGEPEGDVAYLLTDSQIRVDAQGKTAFVHRANKAVDSHGVEEIANLNIEFDPSYEVLTLHSVLVLRGGQAIDKLPGAKIHVLQREKELEYLVFDGSKTANIVLQDVRVGDIIEYAYSISGMNPVFHGKVSGGTSIAWGVPIGRSVLRLLVPEERTINVIPHNTKLTPLISVHDGYREYRLDQTDVPALHIDDNTPNWYDPYAALQWSEYPDWQTVVQWALPLYRVPPQLSPQLKHEVERIARDNANAEDRLLAALKLVQRDIRYLGVEVGQGSHAPNPPSVVFARRFGDCKDKAMLTVTMLQALGIEANPALVNTELGAGIGDEWPTPNAFDHVIVRATVEGKYYWLDATRAPQAGDLAHLFQPDFGLALVLEEHSTGLTKMNSPHLNKKIIHALFDSSKGLNAPVSYIVTTTLQGSQAERMLADIASDGKSDIEKNYLNYYAHDYAGIKLAAPMTVARDEKNNTLTVIESYMIADFWTKTANGKRLGAEIKTSDVDDLLRKPSSLRRTAPLKIDYPQDLEEVTEIRLPEEWKVKPNAIDINDSAFTFSHVAKANADNKGVIITDRFSTLGDHVAPEKLADYAAHLSKAYEVTGFRFSKTLDASPRAAVTPAALSASPESARSSESWDKSNEWSVNVAACSILASLCAIFLMAVTTSHKAHLSTNIKLYLVLVIDACALALFICLNAPILIWTSMGLILASCSYMTVHVLKHAAPPSHWLHQSGAVHGLFRRLAPPQRRATFSLVLDRVVWIAIGMLTMKIFTG